MRYGTAQISDTAYTVAIVGRPNVGKSTLFNRLVGQRLALVTDTPGLTRDRKQAVAEVGDTLINLIDTAGLEEAEQGSISERMRRQTEIAMADADLVLFVIDARAGRIAGDEIFAELARTSGKPVLLLANKCEGRAGLDGAYDAYGLGLGDPISVSAEHGVGIGDLVEQIENAHRTWMENLAASDTDDELDSGTSAPESDEEFDPDRPLRIAVVGRPNAGKSTLVNTILGQERMITGPEAGLTRDSVSSDIEWHGRKLRLFDTAGLRRKSRVSDIAERLSVFDAQRAIKFAEVVVLLIDAGCPFEKQDLNICRQVADEGRALVIAVNKWDLAADPQAQIKSLHNEVSRLLPQIAGVRLVPISALTGRGMDKLMKAVFSTNETWNKRVSTGQLNRFLTDVVSRHTPPAVRGARIRLRFMTQPNARPPTFVIFCSRPEELPRSYIRYLIKGLRDQFDLPGVPIRIHLRKGKNPYVDKTN